MVLVSPSTEIMLKVSATTALTAFCSSAWSMAQSVVTYPSMVHMLGWIIPDPLLMPPMRAFTVPPFAAGRSKSTANSLFTVSVVMMALLASVPALWVSDRVLAIAVTPAVIRSRGRFGPITPVEPSSTWDAGMFKTLAVKSAVCPQISSPVFPVAALAMPAFTTTA